MYERLLELNEAIKSIGDVEELADLCLVCDEIMVKADDIRKEAAKSKALAAKIACLLYMKLDMTGPIDTDSVSATPRILEAVNIPEKTTKEYAQLMESLNVPPELWQSDIVRPHWPGFTEYFTKLLEDGAQLPPGINPTKRYQTFSLILRRKKQKHTAEENPF